MIAINQHPGWGLFDLSVTTVSQAVELGCERNVFLLRVEALSLPFAAGFVEAVIFIDFYL